MKENKSFSAFARRWSALGLVVRRGWLSFEIWKLKRARRRDRAWQYRFGYAELGAAEAEIAEIMDQRDRGTARLAKALARKDAAQMLVNQAETGFQQQPRPAAHWMDMAEDMLLHEKEV